MSNGEDGNGWGEWRKHVLAELKRFNEGHEKLRQEVVTAREEMQATMTKAQQETQKQISAIHAEIAMLKVKSGVWGAAGAMIPVGIMLAMQLLLK